MVCEKSSCMSGKEKRFVVGEGKAVRPGRVCIEDSRLTA